MIECGRRDFLIRCAAAAVGWSAIDAVSVGNALAEDTLDPGSGTRGPGHVSDVRAAHWEPGADGGVICRLCPRECHVAPGDRGACGVRENDAGVYKTLVYGEVVASHVDPVEKKPFFHVAPGAEAFSIATAGCNLHCRFCQNWEISQFHPEEIAGVSATPERIVSAARESDVRYIAFTYNEPIIFYEFVRDVAEAGNAAGMRSLMISNGYIQEGPLREQAARLHAIKIDLKGFTEDYYRDVCGATLAPVLRTLQVLKETGTWFEIVVLVIPTLNDDESQMRAMCKWVADTLGPDVPMHFSRFHPAYRLMNIPSTPVATLERILRYAKDAGVRYAYLGNVPGHPAESTYCPSCGETLVKRVAYTVLEVKIKEGRCPKCRTVIPGRWT
jgi:pyruvate formate lyase activating enzyme